MVSFADSISFDLSCAGNSKRENLCGGILLFTGINKGAVDDCYQYEERCLKVGRCWRRKRNLYMTNKNIVIHGCARMAGECIWVSLLYCNGLVKIDVNNGRLSFVGSFPWRDSGYQMHNRICEYDDKLIFTPWNSNNIAIYDMKKSEFRQISMKDYGYEKGGRFVYDTQKGEKLYLVSENAKDIMALNMQKETIEKIYTFTGYDYQYSASKCVLSIRMKDEIWEIADNRLLWKFNLLSEQYEQAELSEQMPTVYAGCGSDDYLWLLVENSLLYQFTSDGKYFRKYDLSELLQRKLQDSVEAESFIALYLEGSVFLTWYSKNKLFRIPMRNKELGLEKAQCYELNDAFLFLGDQLMVNINHKMYFFDGYMQKEITIEQDQDFKDIFLRGNEERTIECRFLTIEDFVACVIRKGKTTAAERVFEPMIGCEIYRSVNTK